MAYVRVIVGGGPANVHIHLVSVNGMKIFKGLSTCIQYLHLVLLVRDFWDIYLLPFYHNSLDSILLDLLSVL